MSCKIKLLTGGQHEFQFNGAAERGLLSKLPTDPETIRYRRDIFEDFLRFPQLRTSMAELVMKLTDLRDLERFQMDSSE